MQHPINVLPVEGRPNRFRSGRARCIDITCPTGFISSASGARHGALPAAGMAMGFDDPHLKRSDEQMAEESLDW